MSAAYFLGALGLLIALGAWSARRRRRKRREALQRQWGQNSSARQMEKDLLEDVAAYFAKTKDGVPPDELVDQTTWDDLDMDQVFCSLDRCVSVVGSEALYATLRRTGIEDADLARRERMIEELRAHDRLRLDAQEALLRVGRRHFHGATRYLCRIEHERPGWVYDLLCALPLLVCVAGLFASPALILLFPAFAVNLVVHYVTDVRWGADAVAMTHVLSVFSAARALCRARGSGLDSQRACLRRLCDELRPLRRWGMLCMGAGEDGVGNPLALLWEYVRVLFLLNVVGLRHAGRQAQRCAGELARLYALVGEIDAMISVAALRQAGGVCAPAYVSERRVAFRGLVHPLVAQAVPNAWTWTKNTLVTGSNASGKSTFIKAVALNAILAQTICTCFADEFALPRARVMTSMAVKDSVRGGVSYFVAELRSLKRILEAARQERTVLAFVDEILRGTNTVERIAASSAVLCDLCGAGALVMAATHDIELTRMLAEYENVHFRESVTEAGVAFDYKLRPGPSRTRNALLLLESMGFDARIVSRARETARRFEEEGAWPAQNSDDRQ